MIFLVKANHSDVIIDFISFPGIIYRTQWGAYYVFLYWEKGYNYVTLSFFLLFWFDFKIEICISQKKLNSANYIFFNSNR